MNAPTICSPNIPPAHTVREQTIPTAAATQAICEGNGVDAVVRINGANTTATGDLGLWCPPDLICGFEGQCDTATLAGQFTNQSPMVLVKPGAGYAEATGILRATLANPECPAPHTR